MQRAKDDRFYNLIGQRLRFCGQYDGYKKTISRKPNSDMFSIVFKNVETSDGIPFRDHVHILVPESTVNKLEKNNSIGEEFEFTAEIYEYLKKPINDKGLIYRPWSIGLRDMKKLTQKKNDKSLKG